MALRVTRNKKEVVSEVKKEQKKIVQSIAIEQKILEEIKDVENKTIFIVAEQQEDVIKKINEIEKLDKAIEEKRKEIEKIDSKIKNKKAEFITEGAKVSNIKKDIEEATQRTEKEVSEIVKQKEEIISQINREILALQEILIQREKENVESIKENNELQKHFECENNRLIALRKEIKEINMIIEERTIDLDKVKDSKFELLEIRDDIENTKKIIEQNELLFNESKMRLAGLQLEIERTQKKLEKEETRLFNITERERNLDKKESFIIAKYEKAGIIYK